MLNVVISDTKILTNPYTRGKVVEMFYYLFVLDKKLLQSCFRYNEAALVNFYLFFYKYIEKIIKFIEQCAVLLV